MFSIIESRLRQSAWTKKAWFLNFISQYEIDEICQNKLKINHAFASDLFRFCKFYLSQFDLKKLNNPIRTLILNPDIFYKIRDLLAWGPVDFSHFCQLISNPKLLSDTLAMAQRKKELPNEPAMSQPGTSSEANLIVRAKKTATAPCLDHVPHLSRNSFFKAREVFNKGGIYDYISFSRSLTQSKNRKENDFLWMILEKNEEMRIQNLVSLVEGLIVTSAVKKESRALPPECETNEKNDIPLKMLITNLIEWRQTPFLLEKTIFYLSKMVEKGIKLEKKNLTRTMIILYYLAEKFNEDLSDNTVWFVGKIIFDNKNAQLMKKVFIDQARTLAEFQNYFLLMERKLFIDLGIGLFDSDEFETWVKSQKEDAHWATCVALIENEKKKVPQPIRNNDPDRIDVIKIERKSDLLELIEEEKNKTECSYEKLLTYYDEVLAIAPDDTCNRHQRFEICMKLAAQSKDKNETKEYLYRALHDIDQIKDVFEMGYMWSAEIHQKLASLQRDDAAACFQETLLTLENFTHVLNAFHKRAECEKDFLLRCAREAGEAKKPNLKYEYETEALKAYLKFSTLFYEMKIKLKRTVQALLQQPACVSPCSDENAYFYRATVFRNLAMAFAAHKELELKNTFFELALNDFKLAPHTIDVLLEKEKLLSDLFESHDSPSQTVSAIKGTLTCASELSFLIFEKLKDPALSVEESDKLIKHYHASLFNKALKIHSLYRVDKAHVYVPLQEKLSYLEDALEDLKHLSTVGYLNKYVTTHIECITDAIAHLKASVANEMRRFSVS